jgi:glycerol-3-phosphate dehydrogenase
MKRDLDTLFDQEFDLLVIGAGIYGAAVTWDAVLRGLRVALIDKGDFGGATSANSLKIVHGGLRYLQQLDIKRMRESIRERTTAMFIAPHLVHPLPCVMPTYGHMMKGPEVMFAGLLMNDIISFDRNRLEDPEKRIPAGKVISRKTCLERIPGLDPNGVNGGAFWTDAQLHNTERFTLGFVQSAVDQGAVAANYVRAKSLIRSGDRVTGVQAEDKITGNAGEIRARLVLNTAGGWVDTVLQGLEKTGRRVQLSTAMNLVINRPLFSGTAAGVMADFRYRKPDGSMYKGRRVLFITPWQDVTIAGTFHRPYEGDPDAMGVTEEEVQACLEEVNSALPGNPVKREDVSFVYKGFLPMDGINRKNGEVILTKHYSLHDHSREDGVEGLLSVVGVKYTTARDVAQKIVNLVFRKLGDRSPACRTAGLRLRGGEIPRFGPFMEEAVKTGAGEGIGEALMRRLSTFYGSEYPRILEYGQEKAEWRNTLPGSTSVLKAEVLHSVREEMAQKLSDVVLRRTGLGAAGYPGDEPVSACAGIMASELGWDSRRKAAEIGETQSVYKIQA